MTLSNMREGSGNAPVVRVFGGTVRAYGVFAAPRWGYRIFWCQSVSILEVADAETDVVRTIGRSILELIA